MVLPADESVSIQNKLWLPKVLPVVQETPLRKRTFPLLLERKKERRNTLGGGHSLLGALGEDDGLNEARRTEENRDRNNPDCG